MKKSLLGMMTLIFGIAFVFAFTTCDDDNDNDNTHTHSYSATWSRNAAQHWRECSCGAKTDVADHTLDPDIFKCTVCDYDHIHSYSATWSYGWAEHWHECSCGARIEFAQHTGNPCVDCGYSSSVSFGGYSIGDTGPGGGKIFYVSVEGFIMTDTGVTCHLLEVAHTDTGSFTWASYIIEGTETAIGTGRRNTIIILARNPAAPAAKACNDYMYYGKSDWFLPSRDELYQLYINRDAVGLATTDIYWSSSQFDNSSVWVQSFNTGNQFDYSKAGTMRVRAVRAF